MLKVIIVLQALYSTDGAVDCHVHWSTNQTREHVTIYNETDMTVYMILNAADAECVVSFGGDEASREASDPLARLR